MDTRITKKVYEEALKDEESERRVLYVGITRAKEELYLFHLEGSYSYNHLEVI